MSNPHRGGGRVQTAQGGVGGVMTRAARLRRARAMGGREVAHMRCLDARWHPLASAQVAAEQLSYARKLKRDEKEGAAQEAERRKREAKGLKMAKKFIMRCAGRTRSPTPPPEPPAALYSGEKPPPPPQHALRSRVACVE
eukprot:4759368-Prymnesium_polylepis.1